MALISATAEEICAKQRLEAALRSGLGVYSRVRLVVQNNISDTEFRQRKSSLLDSQPSIGLVHLIEGELITRD